MTNKLPQGEQETLKKQATIIRQYLTQEKVAIWKIAEETYKAMGMPTRKMAASRIYRALNLSGYVENIAPVLDFLSKHVAQVTLSKKALKPVNVKAQSVAFAPETTTAPLSTTKHCNGTSETYLKEIRDAITSGRWTMKDAIKLASTVVPTGAKMLPGAFFTTMATLITHPDTIQLFAETEYSTWLEKAITRTWESIPQQSSALRNTMKELMGGFEKLTKLIHEI